MWEELNREANVALLETLEKVLERSKEGVDNRGDSWLAWRKEDTETERGQRHSEREREAYSSLGKWSKAWIQYCHNSTAAKDHFFVGLCILW